MKLSYTGTLVGAVRTVRKGEEILLSDRALDSFSGSLPKVMRSVKIREVSGVVCKSETITLRHPIMPVADGFLGGFVRVYCLELRKRNGHFPPLPAELHEHVVLAGILGGHP